MGWLLVGRRWGAGPEVSLGAVANADARSRELRIGARSSDRQRVRRFAARQDGLRTSQGGRTLTREVAVNDGMQRGCRTGGDAREIRSWY
jgi:hypothetical protein